MKTDSEKIFEDICSAHSVPCEKIEEGAEKTADYLIRMSNLEIIAEVKEIERNAVERESDRLLEERGYGECLRNEPGDRVRNKIRKASPQIKRLTAGSKPGILVLFDGGRAHGHLDPYNLRVAMSGLEQVHIAVPRDPAQTSYATGMSHGPKRKMTEDSNTSISALAKIYTIDKNTIRLDIFHNRHAAIPIDPAVVHDAGFEQYFLVDSESGTSEWHKYEPKPVVEPDA